ncbi:hypothetical protein E2C01_077199 [Portunus trituberculatus]|uniref:Uncharacterized protein n=1 Tax=Portunus trituberculatus TaxID=210409 RepID=A0A5B7IP52_PORTR|nr:hypothetical protein [Portunus trituberculatus]
MVTLYSEKNNSNNNNNNNSSRSKDLTPTWPSGEEDALHVHVVRVVPVTTDGHVAVSATRQLLVGARSHDVVPCGKRTNE